jgi:hypothetical protein
MLIKRKILENVSFPAQIAYAMINLEMGRACSTNGGIRGMHIGYWWEIQKEKDQDVGGWTILKWIL